MKKKISFRWWNPKLSSYWNSTIEAKTERHLQNYIQSVERKGHVLDEQYGTL